MTEEEEEALKEELGEEIAKEILDWMKAERLHSIFGETADGTNSTRQPPFNGKKIGWKLNRVKKQQPRKLL